MTCTASRLVVVLQIHSISFVGQSAIQVTVEIYPGGFLLTRDLPSRLGFSRTEIFLLAELAPRNFY